MKKRTKIGLSIFLFSTFYFLLSTTFGQEIIIDPVTKKIYISGGNFDNIGQSNFLDSYINTQTSTLDQINTGNQDTGTIHEISTQKIISGGTEFDLALAWMYANGLTKYNTSTDYRPYDKITREEAAKIFAQAYIKFGYSQLTKNNNCSFEDSNIFNI